MLDNACHDALKELVETNSCEYYQRLPPNNRVFVRINFFLCSPVLLLRVNKVYEVGQVFPLLLAGREHHWAHLLDIRVYRQPYHPRRSHYIYQEMSTRGG